MRGKDIKLKAGNISIHYLSKKTIEATPIQGVTQDAEGYIYSASHTDGWEIKIAYMTFGFGQDSRDIRCLEYTDDTPDCLHRLSHGLRMSVYPFDQTTDWIELSQARLDESKTPNWSNLKQATEKQLGEGAGLQVDKLLAGNKVFLGSREILLEDSSRRKNYMCILFEKNDDKIPLLAFVITRVLPLVNSYT